VLDVPASITGGSGRSGSFGFQRWSTCARESCARQTASAADKKMGLIRKNSVPKIHQNAKRFRIPFTAAKLMSVSKVTSTLRFNVALPLPVHIRAVIWRDHRCKGRKQAPTIVPLDKGAYTLSA
jgi:hypothetical protein